MRDDMSGESEQPLIVVVEDDPGNAHLLETILQEEAHYRTCVYQSGVSVLQHLGEITQCHPALFLVDYSLPEIDGLSLCKHLHTLEGTQKTPCILVTGSIVQMTIQEAEKQGIPVITKPYDLDAFLEIIEQKVTAYEQFS